MSEQWTKEMHERAVKSVEALLFDENRGTDDHDEVIFCFPRAIQQIEKQDIEIERLRKWVDNLQDDRVVTCVYCGHEYPPGTGTAQEIILTNHIKNCPDHPLRAAESEIERLRAENAELKSILESVKQDFAHEHTSAVNAVPVNREGE